MLHADTYIYSRGYVFFFYCVPCFEAQIIEKALETWTCRLADKQLIYDGDQLWRLVGILGIVVFYNSGLLIDFNCQSQKEEYPR